MEPNNQPPYSKMMQFIMSKWISKPIYAAAKLGIADILTAGPKDIEELARLSKTDINSLYRLMRTLASLGIFQEIGTRQFKLTQLASCLKTGALRSVSLMFHSNWHDRAWDNILHTIKTGESGFEKAHGMSLFEWFNEQPEEAGIFNEANAVKAKNSHRAILDVYDFSNMNTLADIAHRLLIIQLLS